MKIRCKNCYHVLKPQEEYCTSCGEHSREIEQLMKTGYIEISDKDKLKTALIIYALSAIFGNGIYMVILGLIQNKVMNSYNNLFCQSYALLISSIVTTLIFLIIYRKELKDMVITGTMKQIAASAIIGVLLILTCLLFSMVSSHTSALPGYITKFLSSGNATFMQEGDTNIITVLASFTLIIISQEIVFRRRMIDAFDNDTLLGDISIIIFSGLIGTFLDVMWVMSLDIVLTSLIINFTLSGIYMYTNRNVAVTTGIRLLLLISMIILFTK